MLSEKTACGIFAVALNPALDVTLWVTRLDEQEPVAPQREKLDPAGKAVNVARVLTALGIPNRLFCTAGRQNAEILRSLLDREGVRYELLETEGAVRENLSIVTEDGRLFKINRAGFTMSEEALERLSRQISEAWAAKEQSPPSSPIMVFSGSLPQGINKEQYKRMILFFRNSGAKIVLDNSFFSEEDLAELHPWLIKPNLPELCQLSGGKLHTIEEIAAYADRLAHFSEQVMVSMGAQGLLYASEQKRLVVSVPAVEVKSTVGAGDTTIAGFLAAWTEGHPVEACVCYAAACGTASVSVEGTGVIVREDAVALQARVKLRTIGILTSKEKQSIFTVS